MPIVIIGAAIRGLLVGWPSRRLIGGYLAIVTLFFGEALVEFNNNVALNVLFFFSSRRRHTRSCCDWSSDVCSSDLLAALERVLAAVAGNAAVGQAVRRLGDT